MAELPSASPSSGGQSSPKSDTTPQMRAESPTSRQPEGKDDKKRTLRLPNWVGRLIEFAVNPLNDRLITTLLIISSIMLTIVSFTTTYTGVNIYFTNSIFASMAALAIQTLLFATSWRIGAALASKFFNFSLLAIYLITMSVSVFFSYAAFFNSIYPKSNREAETVKLLRSNAKQKTSEILLVLSKGIESTHNETVQRVETWATKVLSDLAYYRSIADLKSARGEEVAKALSQKAYEEDKFGNTEERSATGKGPKYDGIIKKRNDQREAAGDSRGIERAFSGVIASLEKHVYSIRGYFANKSAELPSASQLQADCSALQALAANSGLDNARKPSAQCEEAANFVPNLLASAERYQLLKDTQAACESAYQNAQKEATTIKIQESYTLCWAKISACARSSENQNYKIDLSWKDDLVGKFEWTNTEAHDYTQAVGYLFVYKHPLAIGSLLIAFVIDLLVLLCAFLGARPRSHLDLRKPADLYGAEEEAILTSIYFADWTGKSSSPFVTQIAKIRDAIQFDQALAKEGFAGYLEIEAKEQQKFTYMLSLLIAMELASVRTMKSTDGKDRSVIALRVRLMLWLADLVATERQGKQAGQVGHKLMKELTELSSEIGKIK